MDTYDREFLQSCGKYGIWIRHEPEIIHQIVQEAICGSTQYLIDSHYFQNTICDEEIADWVIARLKLKFPNVTVEYREITNLNNDIERVIVVDWS